MAARKWEDDYESLLGIAWAYAKAAERLPYGGDRVIGHAIAAGVYKSAANLASLHRGDQNYRSESCMRYYNEQLSLAKGE